MDQLHDSLRVSMDIVLANPYYPWNRQSLSNNRNIDMRVILIDLPNATGTWSWYHISKHIDMDDVRIHRIRPWNRDGLSRNPGITLDIVNDVYMPNASGHWDWDIMNV